VIQKIRAVHRGKELMVRMRKKRPDRDSETRPERKEKTA
jgi:hypothetical protein